MQHCTTCMTEQNSTWPNKLRSARTFDRTTIKPYFDHWYMLLSSLHGSYSHATEMVMVDRERKSDGKQNDAMLANQEGGRMPLLKESWIILRQLLQWFTDTSGHLVRHQSTNNCTLPAITTIDHTITMVWSVPIQLRRTEAQWLYNIAVVVGDEFVFLAIYSTNDFYGYIVLAVHVQWWEMSLTSHTDHGQLPTNVATWNS